MRNIFKSTKLALAALMLSMVTSLAFAAGESTGIIASFSEFKTEVLLVIVAFAVVLWAKRGGKLLHP